MFNTEPRSSKRTTRGQPPRRYGFENPSCSFVPTGGVQHTLRQTQSVNNGSAQESNLHLNNEFETISEVWTNTEPHSRNQNGYERPITQNATPQRAISLHSLYESASNKYHKLKSIRSWRLRSFNPKRNINGKCSKSK